MSLSVLGERLLRKDAAAAVDVARKVFRAAGLKCVDVSLTFVLDAEMRALNRRWRGKDRTTDVLSFPAWEGEPVLGDDRFLGDLVLSVETAARQAREHGHDVVTEVAVLVCHGLMHLAGLDHERGPWEHERQLMVEMGILSCAGVDVGAALGARLPRFRRGSDRRPGSGRR